MFISLFVQSSSYSGVELGYFLLFAGIGAVVALAVNLVIGLLLYGQFAAIPARHRTMEPGLVWLLLIPIFNIFWNFRVFLGLADSYANAFAARGRQLSESESGRTIGLWFSISYACSIIPCVNAITSIVALVMLVLFLVKGFGLKSQLESMPENDGDSAGGAFSGAGEDGAAGDGYEERWPG